MYRLVTFAAMLLLAICGGNAAATMVIEEIPVVFHAESSILFQTRLLNENQSDETLVITLPNGSEIHELTATGEIIQVVDKEGRPIESDAEQSAMLEQLEFDTGWFPTGLPFQLRIIFTFDLGIVEVIDSGFIRLVYDDEMVGPGVDLPVAISWHSAENKGNVYMAGGSTFKARWRIYIPDLGIDLEGNLPNIPDINLNFQCEQSFMPFLLDGSNVTCEDDFPGGLIIVDVVQHPIFPWLFLNLGVDLSGSAIGNLQGNNLCINANDTICIYSEPEYVMKDIELSTSSPITNVTLTQSYDADYIFDFGYDMHPIACWKSAITGEIYKCYSAPDYVQHLDGLTDWPVELDFNEPAAFFMIEGIVPMISGTSPDSCACEGDTVDIYGLHFGVVPNEVYFGSEPAEICKWDNTHIEVCVPGKRANGLSVKTVCGTSSVKPFQAIAKADPPASITAIPGCIYMDLAWSPSAEALEYCVYRDDEYMGSVTDTVWCDENPGLYERCYYVRSMNECGEGDASDQVCATAIWPAGIDIKPQSCPNPLNVRMGGAATTTGNRSAGKGGVLPVAVLGTSLIDATEIDPETVQLLGVPAMKWSINDITAPPNEENEQCQCDTPGPDGFADLEVKFEKGLIIDALGTVHDGDTILLTLTGNLNNGAAFEGIDCVIIRGDAAPAAVTKLHETQPVSVFLESYPNPFNVSMVIRFGLTETADIRLEIFNISGQRVATLVSGPLETGIHTCTWDGDEAASGIYFVRLKAGGFEKIKKVILLK